MPAPISGKGAIRASCSRSVGGISGCTGCAWRVRVIGISAAQISMDDRANRVNAMGLSRLSSCCAAASAPRFTAM